MNQEIIIPRKIANQLLHLAQLSPEQEICGLIGGQHGLPTHCYPVGNVSGDPAQRFLLDASEQIAAMKAMREKDEELFAIYHSHPSAPAAPSAADLQQAAYPDALYLIISLNTKGLLEMRGFKIGPQGSEEFPLVLNEH